MTSFLCLLSGSGLVLLGLVSVSNDPDNSGLALACMILGMMLAVFGAILDARDQLKEQINDRFDMLERKLGLVDTKKNENTS